MKKLWISALAVIVVFASCNVSVPVVQAADPPAFPGVQGYGTSTDGGRGGRVFVVNSLEDASVPDYPNAVYDDDTVTLRECVRYPGPRICTFAIAGTIELASTLYIGTSGDYEDYADITIAGQTAPGEGITLKIADDVTSAALAIRTHDVIIQYIKVRPGPGGTSLEGTNGDNVDGISIEDGGVQNLVLDHVSVSWGVDENINFWTNTHDVTLSNSLISEGLHFSTHSNTEANNAVGHSKGLIIGGEGSSDISVYRNVFAHNADRFPETKPESGYVDIVNNIMYNWGVRGGSDGKVWVTLLSDQFGDLNVNVVNNFYKKGLSSTGTERARLYYNHQVSAVGDTANVYYTGNEDHTLGDITSFTTAGGGTLVDAASYLGTSNLTIDSVADIQSELLGAGGAGASRRLNCVGEWVNVRDSVDERVIEDVLNGTGEIIDHPDDVGGWPELDPGTACEDSDEDGMPNEWETLRGLNTAVDDSSEDQDGDGYTNIEAFIFGIAAPDDNSGSDSNSDSSTSSSTVSTAITSATAPQIPFSTNPNFSSVLLPTYDSYTHGQKLVVIIQPNTFSFDAFLSVQSASPESFSPNMPLLNFKKGFSTFWQVGNIQYVWYKTYPASSDKASAIIIPELQQVPSIIALSYTDADLIPPGQPNSRFNQDSLRLAHSIDGKSWEIIYNSVVDTHNKTVAGIGKIGGYYMIVAKPAQ